MRVIFFDTEATGLNISKDRIIQIAAFDPIDKKSFCTYVKTEEPISQNATNIHNITEDFLVNAPSFPEAMNQFIHFLESFGEEVVLVSHNNDRYHQPLIQQECHRHDVQMPVFKTLDTYKISQDLLPEVDYHSLSALAEKFHIMPVPSHRALEDAIALSKVFEVLKTKLPMGQLLSNYCKPLFESRMPQVPPLDLQPRDLAHVRAFRPVNPNGPRFETYTSSTGLWPHLSGL